MTIGSQPETEARAGSPAPVDVSLRPADPEPHAGDGEPLPPNGRRGSVVVLDRTGFSPDPEGARRYLAQYAQGARLQPNGAGEVAEVMLPARYSMIHDADGVLEVAAAVVSHALSGVRCIRLVHGPCVEIDVCAAAFSGALLRKASEMGVRVEWELPPDGPVRIIAEHFWIASARGGPSAPDSGGLGTHLAEQQLPRKLAESDAAEAVIAVIRRTQESRGMLLQRDFAKPFARLLSGAIDNALEHGGDCWVGAVVHPGVDGGPPRVDIALFNLGPSMHQTLSRMPANSVQRPGIEELLRRHAAAGYFDGVTWTEEAVWFRHCLQDGVTSRGGKGGSGTRTVLKAFEYLLDSSPATRLPRMSIVSGGVKVDLDEHSRLAVSTSESRRNHFDLAFNPENRLDLPATSHIRILQRYLPGTMMTLHFHLEPAFLLPQGGPR
ncbi:MAG TPA: hypothetical protein VFS20_30470 [Longimicrobium sp.]|nr:hypothetical protein [Longimicrobium sp.]